eukprot:gene24992-45915_t
MVDELLAIVQRIAAQGVTVLMVEQKVRQALQIAQRGYVLERGRIVASGEASTLLQSDVVRQAYLGELSSMTAISMLINGERVQATGGATFERHNPLDGSVATTAPAASVADAKAAAESALHLFCAWGNAWDKRVQWDAWVAWTRILLQGATVEGTWPERLDKLNNVALRVAAPLPPSLESLARSGKGD